MFFAMKIMTQLKDFLGETKYVYWTREVCVRAIGAVWGNLVKGVKARERSIKVEKIFKGKTLSMFGYPARDYEHRRK